MPTVSSESFDFSSTLPRMTKFFQYRIPFSTRMERSARSILRARSVLRLSFTSVSDGRMDIRSTIAIVVNGYCRKTLTDFSPALKSAVAQRSR